MKAPKERGPNRLQDSPRCGARTRKGTSCRAPAVGGKKRCRMHGGAEGSGAPIGNQNALKHGRFTREAMAERKRFRGLIRKLRADLERFEKS